MHLKPFKSRLLQMWIEFALIALCYSGRFLAFSKNRPDGLSRTSGDDGRLWAVLLQWAV